MSLELLDNEPKNIKKNKYAKIALIIGLCNWVLFILLVSFFTRLPTIVGAYQIALFILIVFTFLSIFGFCFALSSIYKKEIWPYWRSFAIASNMIFIILLLILFMMYNFTF